MAELLKNYYNREFVTELADTLNGVDQNFESKKFINAILDKDWENRELKERAAYITAQMHAFLPYSYQKQIEILGQAAPNFTGFTGIIFPNFIESYGLEDYDTSIKALAEFTPYSTSEFAVRPFLKDRPDTIKFLYKWAEDENYHVRRLASEGCRPLLPWAMKLHQYVDDPAPIIPILEKLKNDPEDYVYRSVANNLNDISKHHPELVLDLAEKWINESDTTRWVCKHALRTLLKKGNQRAMKLFGFGSIKSIKTQKFEIQNTEIKIGDLTHLDIAVKNTGKKAKFRFEYVIGYLKKNGKHSEKVFQLRESTVNENQLLEFTKKAEFKDLSTRKHYPGQHYAQLKINGNVVEERSFVLK